MGPASLRGVAVALLLCGCSGESSETGDAGECADADPSSFPHAFGCDQADGWALDDAVDLFAGYNSAIAGDIDARFEEAWLTGWDGWEIVSHMAFAPLYSLDCPLGGEVEIGLAFETYNLRRFVDMGFTDCQLAEGVLVGASTLWAEEHIYEGSDALGTWGGEGFIDACVELDRGDGAQNMRIRLEVFRPLDENTKYCGDVGCFEDRWAQCEH